MKRRTGGNISQKARIELEQKTGKSVVTDDNLLTPAISKKRL